MSNMGYCYWHLRKGQKVAAKHDGGRFGPLCDKCADILAAILLPP